jgi:hypothetical protein
MSKTLTVHNAEVHTATVEVKSLTISGKQVTLAVFRQLLEEHPLDQSGNWKGTPWGFVNYLNDRRDAVNVVWQKDTELRRGLVVAPPSRTPTLLLDDDRAHEWLMGAYQRGFRPANERNGSNRRAMFRFDGRFPVTVCEISGPLAEALVGRYSIVTGDTTHEERDFGVSEERFRELHRWMRSECEAHDTTEEMFRDRWVEATALPQLFIAV